MAPAASSTTAKTTVSRTLDDLQSTTKAAIEQSKQTASATVADMLETHGMLRSDTTALFERLREANILLQEVLSGAHENMSSHRAHDGDARLRIRRRHERRQQQERHHQRPGRGAARHLSTP